VSKLHIIIQIQNLLFIHLGQHKNNLTTPIDFSDSMFDPNDEEAKDDNDEKDEKDEKDDSKPAEEEVVEDYSEKDKPVNFLS